MRDKLKSVQAAAIRAAHHPLVPADLRGALLDMCALLDALVTRVESLEQGQPEKRKPPDVLGTR